MYTDKRENIKKIQDRKGKIDKGDKGKKQCGGFFF